MPKVKLSPMAEACEMVMRNICAQAKINGCENDAAIAKKLGMTTSTFSYRKKKLGGLKFDELVKASLVFKCSLAWLVTEHKAETKE